MNKRLADEIRRARAKAKEVTTVEKKDISQVGGEDPGAVRADWRDIRKYLPDEGEAIIEGLLSGGSQAKMLISGVSGFGKTTLGLNMAIPIALPGLVFGKLRVPQQRRVVFVDLERVAVAVADQTALLSRTLGEPEPGYLDIITGDFKVLDKGLMDTLREKLRQGPPGVAIFDSIVNLVEDYNDTVQCNMAKDFFQEVLVDLKWAVILLHHVATGMDSGVGHGKALGTLGKTLDRWAGTKLAYEEIPDLENYGRLYGTSRSQAWSKINLLLGYEQDTQVLTSVPWDEIPLPQRQKTMVIGPSPRTLEFRQFWILAKRLGHTAEDIADMIGVSKATLYRYNSGEDVLSDERWQAIMKAWDELRGDAGVNPG